MQTPTSEHRTIADGLATAYGLLSGDITPTAPSLRKAKAALREVMAERELLAMSERAESPNA